jgi:hypothetical protein
MIIDTDCGPLDTERLDERYEPCFCGECGCRVGWLDTGISDDFVGLCDGCAAEMSQKYDSAGRTAVSFAVRRDSADEATYAVVKAVVDEELTREHAFMAALRKALVEWRDTPSGAVAFEESCNDFNFGDLSGYYGDGTAPDELIERLEANGIFGLEATTYLLLDPARTVTFDTRLMKRDDE